MKVADFFIFAPMKAYVILFVALLMLVKPLWPVAEYVMNYNYIANVLCENKARPQLHCDGKCYLAKQLAKEMDQNEDNPFGEKKTNNEVLSVLFFQSFLRVDLGMVFTTAKQDNFKIGHTFLAQLYSSDISEPPEQA